MKRHFFVLAAVCLTAGSVWAGAETGKISRDYWTNHSGGIAKVKQNIKTNVAPTGSDELVAFEAVSWKDPKKSAGFADKYAQRVYGFLIPEKDGEYVFWIAADDQAELALSSDDKAANAKKIAEAKSWTLPKQWTKFKEQKSAPVKLKAGQKYFIEAVMYEGGGGDCLAVAWAENKPDAKPAVIPGKNLAPAPKQAVPAKTPAPAKK